MDELTHLNHGVGLISLQNEGWACPLAAFNLVLAEQPAGVEVHPVVFGVTRTLDENCWRILNFEIEIMDWT